MELGFKKFDYETQFYAAELLLKKKLTFDEIKNKLIERGLDKEDAKILTVALKKWKQRKSAAFISLIIILLAFLLETLLEIFHSGNPSYPYLIIHLVIALVLIIITFSIRPTPKKFAKL